MSRTDLISDALTIIRNALMVKKKEEIIPFSKTLLGICEILKNRGYIENFRKLEEGKKNYIKVYLKYEGQKSKIHQIKRISKPSRRVYVSRKNLPRIKQGRGLAVISTSKGLLSDEEARKLEVGGEVLFSVW